MNTLANYLKEAAKFNRMAEEASDPKLQMALKGQADQYRKLALVRADQLGISTDQIPELVTFMVHGGAS